MGNNQNTPAARSNRPNGAGNLESFVSQIKNIDLDNASLDSLTDSLKEIFGCEAVTLFTYDSSNKELFSSNFRSQSAEEIRFKISMNDLIGYAAANGKPLNINDVHSNEELKQHHLDLSYGDSWDKKFGFISRSMMLIPLPHKSKLVGVMEIVNKADGNSFSEADFIRAKAIALVMGLALVKLEARNNNHHKIAHENNDLKEALDKLTQAILSVKSSDEIFLEINKHLVALFQASEVIIFAIHPQKNILYSKIDSNGFTEEIQLPINHSSIAGFVASESRLLNIKNVNDPEELNNHHPDLQFKDGWNKTDDLKTQSLLTIPLVHSNQTIGVWQLARKNDEPGFSSLDESNASAIAENLALAFQNIEKVEELKPSKFSYLISNGFLTKDELTLINKKSQETGSDVEDLLVKELYLRSIDVGKSLEHFYYIPYTGFDDSTVSPDLSDFEFEVDTLRKQSWVPLKNDDTGMVILVNDPTNTNTIEKIKQVFPDKTIDFRVGLKMDITEYINGFYKTEEIKDIPETEEKQNILETVNLAEDNTLELVIDEEYQAKAPENQVISPGSSNAFFDEMLSIAIRQGVTDIHIEPGKEGKNLLIRLRKDGACRVFEEVSSSIQTDIISHIKKLAQLDASINQIPQNGKFIWPLESNKYELSVVVFPTIGNLEDAMLRISQIGKPVPRFIPITQMEFSDPNLDKIMSRIHATKGMILVTGLEGAGKTTSLHAFLGHLNTPEKKIVTAESPVDIVQNGLRQIQINDEIGLNYTFALETFLLGNPDIIMIGETLDPATMKLSVEAARERLIFSSLPAKSSVDAIRKIREMNIDSNQFADSFLFIMAQKLVPSLCGSCKEDYHPSQEEFDMLEKFYGSSNFADLGFQYNNNLTLKKAVGCKQCIFTGYSGEIALQEVLERTPELNRLIAQKASIDEIHNQALEDGMITLNQDGIYKIINGDCDFKKIQEAFLPGRY